MSDFLDELASLSGREVSAPVPVVVIGRDPFDLVRDGYRNGNQDPSFVLEAMMDGSSVPEEHGPGLNVGLRTTALAATEYLLTTNCPGVVVLMANAVAFGETLVFDGSELEPTRFIHIRPVDDGFELDEHYAATAGEALLLAEGLAKAAAQDHADHGAARAETGFWGRAGAGCVVVARSTGRMMIGLRSGEVMEPGTWGTFGGAIDGQKSPAVMVRKEIREETGYLGEMELVPLYVFEAPGGTFRYHNFMAVVDEEFEAELNWEHDDARWFEPNELPEGLHFGLQALLADEASMEAIKGIGPGSSPRP